MDYLKLLEEICTKHDCYMEYVGENASEEYVGWENHVLIFANDAKEGEYDLAIIDDSNNNLLDFVSNFLGLDSMPLSIKKIRETFIKLLKEEDISMGR